MLEIDEMNASVVLADVVNVVPTRGSAEKQHKKGRGQHAHGRVYRGTGK